MPAKAPVRALPASPPRFSLLSSAEVLNESDNRWEAGVKYEPEICGDTGTGIYAGCETSNVSADPGIEIAELEPFVIWAGDSCSPVGNRDWQGRARKKLGACESSIIETELWRGAVNRAQDWANPYLASPDAVLISGGTPLDPTNALACLEQALADCNCGSNGMIHATHQLVTLWAAASLIIVEQSRLVTHLGTVIVPGAGYDGSGPAPTHDDLPEAPVWSIWAYATSPVHLRLGPVAVLPSDLSQSLNRVTNTAFFWAQRIVVAGFDCCHYAVEVDVAPCSSGS